MAEEFTWLEAESPAPKIEEKKITERPLKLEEATRKEATVTAKAEPKAIPTLKVSASIYHPEPGQTDGSPLITADGSRINKRNPGKHRWIAVSRDLHSRWGRYRVRRFALSIWYIRQTGWRICGARCDEQAH
ncbi:RlpA-like double-psi beta-barrel domain-containing protein [Pontibacter rugosus]